MTTLVRRVGVRDLRLHLTVTGRLRQCPAEPTQGRGDRVGLGWDVVCSSRDKLEVALPCPYRYPSWGAAELVGRGSRGAREGSADPIILSRQSGTWTRNGNRKGVNFSRLVVELLDRYRVYPLPVLVACTVSVECRTGTHQPRPVPW